ncbi:MAG: Asparagine synthetase [Clostridia bacterium 41_269]|nr:MAG: Asparagine synthetase [Clostridia bacterium 41_269]
MALSGECADEIFCGYPWFYRKESISANTFPWTLNLKLPGEYSLNARLREIAYLTLTRWMPVLLDRKDRMSMAAGLEIRVPFCDHRLVEYVFNVPWELKNYGGQEKGLLRASLKGVLPQKVLQRKKKPLPQST